MIDNINRTEWIRRAIAEKIARDTNGNDAESGETAEKEQAMLEETPK
jgi:hypothetical protein